MELSESTYAFFDRILQAVTLQKNGEGVPQDECADFWDSEEIFEWFKAKGYTLYKLQRDDVSSVIVTAPRLPFEPFAEFEYPYAYHNAACSPDGIPSLKAGDHTHRILYAQDARHKHVAIKMVDVSTEEYRILRFLSGHSLETFQENCILPILELIHTRNVCFVVMPRWGICIEEPRIHTVRDVLQIMHSALKALSFLHAHNIVWRDASLHNMLVNHFGDQWSGYDYWDSRTEQLKAGQLCYALVDFDMAMMVPPGIKREDFRLPCEKSFEGSFFPADTMQGEFDYDPFAFDVGALGAAFCGNYQHLTTDLPLLAPFLDRMVTRNIANRFSAAEALSFVQDCILPRATSAQLNALEHPYGAPYYVFEEYDRWASLPEEFQKEWAAYREPLRLPLMTRILRAIVHSDLVPPFAVSNTRLFFFKLTYVPRYLYTRASSITLTLLHTIFGI